MQRTRQLVTYLQYGDFVGGLVALVPSRTNEIPLVGLQALQVSFLATLLTEHIAGCLVI